MLKNNIIIISVLFLFASWHVMDMPVESFHSSVTKNAVVNVSKKYAVDETVNIKIFSQIKVQSFTFSAEAGAYSIWANGVEVATTKQSPLIKLTYVNDSVEVKTFENVIGKYKRVKISSPDFIKSFRMKLISPDRKPRFYEDNLYVTTELGDLKCLNEISLDNYIAGVVQAESGRRSFQEFYKVQAILARTFALSHLQKHAPEGFNLCDHTHCQAYFGKTTELDIMKAVTDTKGKVVVDDNLNLIDAAFHSNSGGQTANSEDVWGSKLSYLRSVNDTFSTKMPNAKWERKMAKEDWLSYLKLKHNYPIQDSNARWLALTFKQDSRKPFLEANNVRVPLKNVRTDLQLKSTFFSVVAVGDTVIFKGKGFGHGVGMCQEGAMRMAKLGYKCPEVINFYYQKTQLIDLHKLNFFKDE
ncbi:MAG: SpoIID/LytB domain-containing protein [Bacteroidetes bacterium]|jgi:stage II sporulation protein D|nr:SpoIID/LytB domain-containing protein [Bacteroidota bacterium]